MMVGRWILSTGAALTMVAVATGVALASSPAGNAANAFQASLLPTTAKPVAKAASHVHHASAHQAVDNVLTVIETGAIDGRHAPEFLPGNFQLPAHATIHMTVISFDDGPAPTPGYTKIKGVSGNAVTLDGKRVTRIAANDIAHTFTVPALGLNVPIPAAPTGKYVTVAFTFHTGGAGRYAWQCYALCGAGQSGWGYPMTANGMMRGVVKVG